MRESGDNKKPVVTNGGTSPVEQLSGAEFTDSDRQVMASAKAFTEAYNAK